MSGLQISRVRGRLQIGQLVRDVVFPLSPVALRPRFDELVDFVLLFRDLSPGELRRVHI